MYIYIYIYVEREREREKLLTLKVCNSMCSQLHWNALLLPKWLSHEPILKRIRCIQGYTLVSLSLRLKELPGPVTRVKKKHELCTTTLTSIGHQEIDLH